MRPLSWLLLGLAQAFLTVRATLIVPFRPFKERREAWVKTGCSAGLSAPSLSCASFKYTKNRDRNGNGLSNGEVGRLVFKGSFCSKCAFLTKLASRTEATALHCSAQRHKSGYISEAERSCALRASPSSETAFQQNPAEKFVNEDAKGSSPEAHSAGASADSLLPPRGFRDFPPSIFSAHKYVFSKWHQVASEFGFREYKAPSVERSSLYSHFSPSGSNNAPSALIGKPYEIPSSPPAIIPPHIYRLHVSGPDPLCLRPEITPSLARMLQREQQQQPSGIARRWYSIERVWRHERPGCGRRREHFQWNLDIILPLFPETNPSGGIPSEAARQGDWSQKAKRNRAQFCPPATAELIAAAVRLFQNVGLSSRDVRIRIGSRALLSDLLKTDKDLRAAEVGTSVSESSINTRTITHDGCPFEHKLITAMQVLDRASRQSQEETQKALAERLNISLDKSRRVLHRVLSFDVNSDAMAFELSEELRELERRRSADCRNGDISSQNHLEEQSFADSGKSQSSQELPDSVRELRYVLHLLKEGYGIGDWIDMDLLIVRGLHYYAGIVFEAFDTEAAFRAILGGGCYGGTRANSPEVVKTDTGPHISKNKVEMSTANQSSNAQAFHTREGMRPAVTGVGLGMGDCVLMELLQRKGLLPHAGSAVDVLVILHDKSAAERSRRRHGGALTGKAPANQESTTDGENEHSVADACDIQSAAQMLHSVADTYDPRSAPAQMLCCRLRELGLRVELLLPPQRSTRAIMKHARSVGAKTIVFVATSGGQLPLFGLKWVVPGGTDDVQPSISTSSGGQKGSDAYVPLRSNDEETSMQLSKQQRQPLQANQPQPVYMGTSNLKRAENLYTLPSVVEMLKVRLRHYCTEGNKQHDPR
ncbi:histidyl-tRNA synthetase, putative [Eimeria tenella]|uniref:histidine--tRNA ligase n=1 Tax=Eimeria tenella TaxID=5802 RepID=U6KZ97_EIMTE|nr:histidyl-tRNA synthetase, putative [Eimeria tenella]CDJ43291.1 histidyl-tRNA synthetase, putative [Eimeria tenella]|eukprot:XP_013234041.1 histidyl-tRNA synthetase, putative [Eimeria tenella]